MSCGADTEAQLLFTALTADANFVLPDIDLSGPEYQIPTDGPIALPIERITNADLTTGDVDGPGTFDVIMRGFKAHLIQEYKGNRITGADYVKAYIALTEAAMSNATQFLLGKDQQYWQAVLAQQQALAAQVAVVISRVQLATTKADYEKSKVDAAASAAGYALTKLKLSTESETYCQAKFTLEFMLPQQLLLLKEQTDAQRAQTLDTRADGGAIAGTLGKQKELYSQQITSYQRDAEIKAAKIFTDAWITQKTIDEGLLAPPNFQNASVDIVLGHIKANNNLD